MKLLNRDNQTVVSTVTLENVKQALIWEYIDHIDNNILNGTIYDTSAIVVTSETLQSIKFANDLSELLKYVYDIGWEFQE